MTEQELQSLVAKSIQTFGALSPEEQAEHRNAQRESFVRGQIGMGNDRDEAEHRAGMKGRA